MKVDAKLVKTVHEKILKQTKVGLPGVDTNKLEGALSRLDMRFSYEGKPEDVFDLAAWYGVVIAKAHAFSDGNKRTAFTVMLQYLAYNGIAMPKPEQWKSDCGKTLVDKMVEVADSSEMDHKLIVEDLSDFLYEAYESYKNSPQQSKQTEFETNTKKPA